MANKQVAPAPDPKLIEGLPSLKEQIITNAVAHYGPDHPYSDRYDVITLRSWGAPPASTNFGVALIVYEGETKARWKLLMRSNMHTHLEVAMEELRVWLMDMVFTDICNMALGDSRGRPEQSIAMLSPNGNGAVGISGSDVTGGVKRKKEE
ncbi:hypothetical protein BDV96DRAFT_654714 [Lophiotrema nucula]|uniref:Uncharacterized protein n=1 Tax=Lophiotrema nucula TaxID=690887 RepID=A0A6A5YH11_9PLEO|nr:hypothetical protein BDV96DRAFT_654714 [Lophiotrema nucula]